MASAAALLLSGKTQNVREGINEACAAVVLIGATGLLINGYSLWIVLTKVGIRNAFGAICFGFLCCNIGVLLTASVWTVVALYGDKLLAESLWSVVAGLLIQALFYGSITFHLNAGINRFCAIAYPIKYKTMFSIRRIWIVTVAVLIIFICICSVYFFDGCHYRFDEETLLWDFQATRCGSILQYADLCFGVTVGILMAAFDVITLLKYRAFRKKLQFAAHCKYKSKEYSAHDGTYFVQSFVSSLVHLICLPIFHLSPIFINSKWGLFCSITIVFMMAFTIDPIIIPIMYLRVIWRWRKRRSAVTQTSIFRKAPVKVPWT